MKRVTRIFVLSKSEQRVVLIVVLALIAGGFVRYERRAHQFPVQVTTTIEPKASPSAAEAKNER
jgi:hypothetical protein